MEGLKLRILKLQLVSVCMYVVLLVQKLPYSEVEISEFVLHASLFQWQSLPLEESKRGMCSAAHTLTLPPFVSQLHLSMLTTLSVYWCVCQKRPLPVTLQLY